jgi:trans-2,3-dihydro-3-hydroxyanthranilate isomerase
MSTQRRFHYELLDVFTKTRLQGNPLAVFPSADELCDADMQKIAAELNLSETVFLCKPRRAGAVAKARIFTPRRELDFAGHPTIGSAHAISRHRELATPFAIEENAGLIAIESDVDEGGDQRFWLTTPKLAFFETLDIERCGRLLNLWERDFAGHPAQFVSAGSPLLVICLDSPEAVDRAELQQAHLGDAIGSANSVGTFVFARKEPGSTSCFNVYSRMFAPQTGISEDPATGGAGGPLVGYMHKIGMLPRRDGLQFESEQGTKMGRRSAIHVRVAFDGDDPTIKVGGSAVLVAEGTFVLDAPELPQQG